MIWKKNQSQQEPGWKQKCLEVSLESIQPMQAWQTDVKTSMTMRVMKDRSKVSPYYAQNWLNSSTVITSLLVMPKGIIWSIFSLRDAFIVVVVSHFLRLDSSIFETTSFILLQTTFFISLLGEHGFTLKSSSWEAHAYRQSQRTAPLTLKVSTRIYVIVKICLYTF